MLYLSSDRFINRLFVKKKTGLNLGIKKPHLLQGGAKEKLGDDLLYHTLVHSTIGDERLDF